MLNRNGSSRRVIFSDAEDLPKSAGSVLVAKRWDSTGRLVGRKSTHMAKKNRRSKFKLSHLLELRLAASSRLLERAGQPGQRPPGVLDRELIPRRCRMRKSV